MITTGLTKDGSFRILKNSKSDPFTIHQLYIQTHSGRNYFDSDFMSFDYKVNGPFSYSKKWIEISKERFLELLFEGDYREQELRPGIETIIEDVACLHHLLGEEIRQMAAAWYL